MKIRLLSLLVIAFSLALSFTACKKDNSSSSGNTTVSQADAAVQADDQTRVAEEINAVSNDADAAVSSESSLSGKVLADICNANIVADTTGDTKKITITYDGKNCELNRSRTGTVVISMAKSVHWKDAGAVITIAVQDLKITRLSDNKSITINGTKTITNVTGGLLKDLSSMQGGIEHDINSDGITITFDNNTQRSWKLAIKRTFTYDNGIVITEEGTHTEGTTPGVAVWGTNRFGNAFTWAITSPLVVRQDCNFRLTSGSSVHTGAWGVATMTFGLDATGVATSCPGTGSYYFKTVFVGSAGKTYTFILPY
ncbi:MAG: hypothetical protein JSS70_02030 [Bacteroidetes bacterium]|nr:hypothetical protein [Bacteroidota bacterium]